MDSYYVDNFYIDLYDKYSEADLVTVLKDLAMVWDRLLNDIWKYLQTNMGSTEFEALKKTQIKWVEKK